MNKCSNRRYKSIEEDNKTKSQEPSNTFQVIIIIVMLPALIKNLSNQQQLRGKSIHDKLIDNINYYTICTSYELETTLTLQQKRRNSDEQNFKNTTTNGNKTQKHNNKTIELKWFILKEFKDKNPDKKNDFSE